MSDDLTLAYLAGVIDSDGYITVHRSTRRSVVYYAARIGITGTRREPHDIAASLWGGTVSQHTPRNSRHRLQYQWSRTGDAAVPIIEAVRPFLRVKRAQADIALEVQEHVVDARAEDPFPWFGPDYDCRVRLAELRTDVVAAMRSDGRTWDEMP